MRALKTGIDAGSLAPLGLSPFETLDWAIMNEADGVRFSAGAGPSPDRSFLREISQYAEENRLYVEWGGGAFVPLDPATGKPSDIAAVNRTAAEQASAVGADTVLAAHGGPPRWSSGAPAIEEALRLAARSLKDEMAMLEGFGVTLALETGSIFTTFELLRLFEACGAKPGGPLGVCLGTLDVLGLLEAPAAAAGRVLPWVAATRIEDGAILLSEEGFAAFTVEAGSGVIDLEAIVSRLSTLDRKVPLTLADRAGETRVAAFELGFADRLPDLSPGELIEVLRLSMTSQRLLDEGRLALMEPARWPEHCERRVKRGLRALRRLAAPFPAGRVP